MAKEADTASPSGRLSNRIVSPPTVIVRMATAWPDLFATKRRFWTRDQISHAAITIRVTRRATAYFFIRSSANRSGRRRWLTGGSARAPEPEQPLAPDL